MKPFQTLLLALILGCVLVTVVALFTNSATSTLYATFLMLAAAIAVYVLIFLRSNK